MYTEEEKNKIIEELKVLLSIPSNSDYKYGVNLMAGRIIQLTKDLPIKWERFESKVETGDYLVGRSVEIKKDKPMVLLSAHMDTVYSANDVKVRVVDNKIYGAGAEDIKSGIEVIIEILRNLNRTGQLNNIIVSFSSEEEKATLNFRPLLSSLAKEADYVMVFESSLNSDHDAPLDQMSIVRSRRGFQGFSIEVVGPGGHSGVLYKKEHRKNAVLKMAEIILKLEGLADYEKFTTVNTGVIEGGKTYNTLAPYCKIKCDCRFKFNNEMDRFLLDVRELLKLVDPKKDFKITLTEDLPFPAMLRDPLTDEFAQLCFNVSKNLNIKLSEEDRGGGSEASMFQFANPKAKVLDGFGPRGGEEHTPLEFVHIDSIFISIELGFNIIKSLI